MVDASSTEGPALDPVPAGTTLAYERYELISFLGRGGQSDVHFAIDRKTGVHVALKTSRLVDRAHLTLERELLHELGQNIKTGIPTVYDFTEEYLALNLLPGEPLHQYASGDTLENRARLLLPICDTIHDVHDHGVVHCDLKPANVLLADNPSLVDFGSARKHPSLPLEKPLGTPRYLAPEQTSGITTPQTDQYSLAIVFYEFLTGRKYTLPDRWPEPNHPLPLLHFLPTRLMPTIMRALSHAPEERFPTVLAFKEELERAL